MTLLPRFYLRLPVYGNGHSLYSQDWPTVMMLWRWIHLTNIVFGITFPAGGNAPKDPEEMRRPNTEIRRVTWWYYKTTLGRRAWLELFEDMFGIRLCPIMKKIARILGIKLWLDDELRTDNWFVRLATLDNRIDYTAYDRESEKPKVSYHV